MNTQVRQRGRVLGLAAALALLLGAAGCGPQAAAPSSPLLAEVNGEAITQADLDHQRRMAALGIAGAAPGEAEPGALLESMIDQRLMLQEARRRGIRPDPAEADSLIESASEGYTLPDLKAALADQGIPFEEWQEGLTRRWILGRLVEKEVVSRLNVGPQQVKDYYWEHLNLFHLGQQRRVRQIVTARREDAQKALERVLLGDSFAAVAKAASQGPQASQGGDLGWVTRQDLPSSLGAVAFALKSGRPSGVFSTPWGWQVLLVEGIRPAGTRSLEDCGAEIREELIQKKETAAYQAWLFTLRRAAKILRFEGH